MKKFICLLMAVSLFFVPFVPVFASKIGLCITCSFCGDTFYLTGDGSYVYFADDHVDILAGDCVTVVKTYDFSSYFCDCYSLNRVSGYEHSMSGDIIAVGNAFKVLEPELEFIVHYVSLSGIITGDPVPNAEYYQLYEKIGTEYILVRTQGNLEFDLNEVVKEPGHDSPGDYTFVVKACAEGYESSDYSNEVVYTVK